MKNTGLIIFVVGILVLGLVAMVCFKRSDPPVEASTQQIKVLLQQLKTNMDDFVRDLSKKFPTDQRVRLLAKRYKDTRLSEAPEPETYTLNKGEQMLMCMRNNYKESDKYGEVHDDMNLLMFVGLHELAHIMSVTAHHTDEFWSNFKFILEEAAEMGYYRPVDYSHSPMAYCAMLVYENPYFHPKTKEERVQEVVSILFN